MSTTEQPQSLKSKPWYQDIQAGAFVRPVPLWNQTERPPRQLPSPVKVLKVTQQSSQSGVLFTVRTKGGTEETLDAGWFSEYQA